MHYLLFYDISPDYLDRRALFRDAHLSLAWKAHEKGELVLGGALADPVDGTLLLFSGDSPEVAERFAKADPYGRTASWCAGGASVDDRRRRARRLAGATGGGV